MYVYLFKYRGDKSFRGVQLLRPRLLHPLPIPKTECL